MRITRITLLRTFDVGSFIFFIAMALLIRHLLASVLLGVIWSIGLAADLYLYYHYKHASKHERQRMESQIPIRRYFYDRWYTPADSTRTQHMKEQLREMKKKVRRR